MINIEQGCTGQGDATVFNMKAHQQKCQCKQLVWGLLLIHYQKGLSSQCLNSNMLKFYFASDLGLRCPLRHVRLSEKVS